MKVKHSVSLTVSFSTTVEEIEALFEDAPKEAKVSIRHTTGDRPWESTSYTITVSWEQ